MITTDTALLRLRHIPTLDYLRGVVIILVIIFHSYGGVIWEPYLGSIWGALMTALVGEFNYGVQLFFLLSGFLITGGLLHSRAESGYYGSFYIKRALRILPLFFLMLVVIKIWLPVSWAFFLASCLFLSNFARLFGAHLNEFGPLWSLCVEEHFYLIWPTVVRRFSVTRLPLILLTIIVLEPLLRYVAITYNSSIDIRLKHLFYLTILLMVLFSPLLFISAAYAKRI